MNVARVNNHECSLFGRCVLAFLKLMLFTFEIKQKVLLTNLPNHISEFPCCEQLNSRVLTVFFVTHEL